MLTRKNQPIVIFERSFKGIAYKKITFEVDDLTE
jgi:hypothetical protein